MEVIELVRWNQLTWYLLRSSAVLVSFWLVLISRAVCLSLNTFLVL